MKRHSLKIALTGLCVAVLAGATPPFLAAEYEPAVVAAALAVAAIGLILLAALAMRLLSFRGKLVRFARFLLAGKYEAGIPTGQDSGDEIGQVESLLNRLAERLHAYDRLRAERVRLSQLTLDAVLDGIAHPVMLFDVERRTFECNPAMRSLLGTQRQYQGVSLDALEKAEGNRTFTDLLRQVVETEKQPLSGRVSLRLPAHEAGQDLLVRIIPVKDREDAVKTAIVLAESPAGNA